MGWLVMYAAVFMLMASSMINYSVERRDTAELDQASTVAGQMVAWHKAAVALCNDPVLAPLTCQVSGPLAHDDVKSRLGYLKLKYKDSSGAVPYMASTAFVDSTVYNNGYFVALVDTPTRVIVTYYRKPGSTKQYNGTVVSELTVGQGWSAMMGFYDAANNRVDRVAVLADDNPIKLNATLPASTGSLIPDNAPVIVTRY